MRCHSIDREILGTDNSLSSDWELPPCGLPGVTRASPSHNASDTASLELRLPRPGSVHRQVSAPSGPWPLAALRGRGSKLDVGFTRHWPLGLCRNESDTASLELRLPRPGSVHRQRVDSIRQLATRRVRGRGSIVC